MMSKKLKVTQIRSTAGRSPVHRATIKGLGLRGIRHSVVVLDDPCTRGMINQVSYLLKVEECSQ